MCNFEKIRWSGSIKIKLPFEGVQKDIVILIVTICRVQTEVCNIKFCFPIGTPFQNRIVLFLPWFFKKKRKNRKFKKVPYECHLMNCRSFDPRPFLKNKRKKVARPQNM